MKKPSLWKQIHEENAAFVDQFSDEQSYAKAGLSEHTLRLVEQKLGQKVLRGLTQAVPGEWQVRFSLNKKQEILFSCHCLSVAALMRDLLLTMLLRYPHCLPNPFSRLDPKKENAHFNLPLSTRENYACFGVAVTKSTMDFLERVEKLLLDKGILYPITPEEAAALSPSKEKEPSAQLRYQKRRSTQLDQALEQIQTLSETCVRHFDLAEKTNANLEVLSQQLEFSTGQFESLKLAVEKMTATFQKLIDEARSQNK